MEPDGARGTALHFLGWDQPAVVRGVAWLLARAKRDAALPMLADLSDTLVVTPTARGGRVLDALLSREAFAQGLALTPPRVTTPQRLVETLWSPALAGASALARCAAWARALERADARVRATLMPNLEPDLDTAQRLRLGSALEALSNTLAWGLLRAEDVAARVSADAQRWEALAQVQESYEQELSRRGWCDPLLAWGRACKEGQGKPRGDAGRDAPPATGVRRVVLLCVPELPAAARAALRLADRVDALVLGDEQDHRGGVDDLGCVRRDVWETRNVPIDEGVLEFSGTWREQAWRAVELLQGGGGSVALGVCDPDMVPTLRRAAEALGARAVHDPAGMPLSRTALARVLLSLLEMVREGSVASLALLTRLPRVERALGALWRDRDDLRPANAAWLDELDGVLEASVDARLEGCSHPLVTRLRDSVRELLEGDSLDDAARPARSWARMLLAMLERVAPELEAEDDAGARAGMPDTRRAGVLLRGVLEDCVAGAGVLAEPDAPLSAAQFTALFEHALTQAPATPFEHGRDSVEALGWLELVTDPAASLVLTGAHEGRLPSRAEPVLMLPDGLASRLGLPCNGSRRARDAALLWTLLRSRRVRIICGRQDVQGDAVWPGRLLLAEPAPILAERLHAFLRAPAPARTPQARRDADGFPLHPMLPAQAVASMSVTAFRDYLSSPYLFYLRHVLGLRQREEPEPVLNARHFGDLVHRAAQSLLSLSREDSLSVERTRDFLAGALEARAAEVVGAAPGREVRAQLVIARRAVDELARLHTLRAREGWMLEHAEWSPREAALLVDGEPMQLRGRIDRIERHEETGALSILDIKTGGKDSPDKAHRTRDGSWTDLQLPLYRHLARSLLRTPEQEPQLGFLLIPASGKRAEVKLASWSAGVLLTADETAAEVVRGVRAGQFAPNGEENPYEAVYAALCGVPLGLDESLNDEGGEGAEGEDEGEEDGA